jgi:uncharacterized protein (TIGR03435 family)
MMDVFDGLAVSVLAKATLIVATGLMGSWLARGSRAAVRHAVLAASFAALLALPIASVVVPPVRVAVPVVRSVFVEAVDVAPQVASSNVSDVVPSEVSRWSLPSVATLLLAGWFAGAVFFLLRMMVGLRQVHSLRRYGLPWRDGQNVVDRLAREAGVRRRVEVLLHESLPAPVTCGVVHPVIVLPPDAQNWGGEDLNRAIMHELEHVRRGDWVSHCLARAVRAAYWFHPLVWIAWRQLALEAERSCDDAVLRHSEATAYADQLVGLAQRLSTARKSPALAMANRSDLSARVGAVLDSRQARGEAGSFLLAVVCIVATVAVLAMSPVRMVAAPQTASSQSPAVDSDGVDVDSPAGARQNGPRQSPASAEFDAVPVKLIDPNSQGSHWHEHSDAKYLNITGSIHGFILRTYGIRDTQLSGEPDWFNSRLYTIEAVTSAPATEKQMIQALRGVLADRFHLKLRQENRDLPVLALEVAPKGPRFRELKPGEVPATHDKPAPGIYARTFTSVEDLMSQLNGVFGGPAVADRPVVNRTHLTGNYDMHLETERQGQADDASGPVPFPNLPRDMQSELGLRLVAERGSLPCFVVEYAEAPAPN